MEVEQLYGFVFILLLVGMTIGVGVLILDKMTTSVYTDRTVTNENITWPGNLSTVSLAHGNLTGLSDISNLSGVTLPAVNYSVNLGTGVVTALYNASICKTGQTCQADYVWRDYSTNGAAAGLAAARDAISGIATNWMSLIVTIAVLGILLVLVIRSFGQRR